MSCFVCVKSFFKNLLPWFCLPVSAQHSSILFLPKGISVFDGGVVNGGGEILPQFQQFFGNPSFWLTQETIIEPVQFKGRLVIIGCFGQENWYHWLLQVLPRLKTIVDAKVEYDKIFVNHVQFEWQKKSLACVLRWLKIPEDKVWMAPERLMIQADMLIVPPLPFRPLTTDRIPIESIQFLKMVFLSSVGSHKPKRLYISRAHASSRRISNEDAVIDLLRPYGFEVVFLEHLSPQEQAQLFHQAEIIMGPHGSGFANLIFAQPQTTMIEIDHALPEARPFFKALAEQTQCQYHIFQTNPVSQEDKDLDIIVDIQALQAFLKTVPCLKIPREHA